MAITTVGAEELYDYQFNALANLRRTLMAQRVNARFPIDFGLFKVWDAVSQPLPSDGTLESAVEAAQFTYTPASLDTPFFVAGRAYRVVGITGRVEVAGTGGAATAVVKKAASATAITAGTALHTGSFNFVGSAATNQVLSLSATPSDLDIASGTCIGLDLTGTITSATGTVTVLLAPRGSPDDLQYVSGTFGSSPPYVGTPDLKAAGAGTRYARLLVRIPPDFEGNNQTLTLRLISGMKTTVADTLATIDVEAWRIDADGTYGAADVCTSAAATINSLTAASKDFNIDPSTLSPGDLLDVRVAVAVTDAASVTAVIGAIWQAEFQADLR
jgi:hypothetical protein